MDGVQVEKRGCIWLVRLLSPNTCTPSTQQPTRHPLNERFLAPNASFQSGNQSRFTSNSSFQRDHIRLWVPSYRIQTANQKCSSYKHSCICLICPHSVAVVLYQIWGSALADWSVLADLPVPSPSIFTTFQLLHSLHQMPVSPMLSSFENDSM
jgi:hypothetical protein